MSVGAVNVAMGNFAYFDTSRMTLRAEHFIASGALPSGFAAVEIDGQFYWDGGLMSNTPLYEIAQATPRRDTFAFQVDLWSARGPVSDSIVDVMGHVKDVQFSSRTRLVTDQMQRAQRYRNVLRHVLDLLSDDVCKSDEWCRLAEELACSKHYNIVHLIYRHKEYEGHFKDYQFGFSTMPCPPHRLHELDRRLFRLPRQHLPFAQRESGDARSWSSRRSFRIAS